MTEGTLTEAVADDPVVAGNAADAMAKAARAQPTSGSVTQSSNVDDNNITIDKVDITAEYGSGGPSFSVENGTEWSIGMGEGNPRRISDTTPPWQGAELSKRITGGTLYVDAYTDIEAPTEVAPGGGTYDFTFPGISAPVYRQVDSNVDLPAVLNGVMGQATCTGCSFVLTNGQLQMTGGSMTFISNDDFTETTLASGTVTSTPDADYLAGGVWLIVPDDASSADDYVFGAFADGNDPFVQSNLAAVMGVATYVGDATGVYSGRTETDISTEIGPVVIGSFDGEVTLMADFGDGSALGTISGSITNFEMDGEMDGVPESGTLNLGMATIGPQDSGFFTGAVTGFGDSTGYWGGQFYGNEEADGKPGSVAGTFGGRSERDAVNFVGVFGAHKQQ